MNHLINQLLQAPGQKQLSRLTRWVTLIALLCIIIACASIPHTGRRQLNLVSDRQLNELGLRAFQEITAKETESKNQRLKAIIERVAKRISKVAEKMDGPRFDWEVKLIDKDVPNAVCLPGGKIVVFTDILKYAKNEAGLATIIAHEIAHAVARHGGERLSQQLALRGALSVGGQVLKSKDGKLDRKSQLILGALGVGGTLGIILPYSRVHELEADRIGQIYMAAAGYDPVESVRLWKRMSRIKKPPIPVWLSTHPSDQDRIRKLNEFLPDAQKHYQEAPVKYGRGSMI